MHGDAPMTCSVYQSRLYSLAMLAAVLAFAAACAWFFPHFHVRPGAHVRPAPDFMPHIVMPGVFALFISLALVALLHSLFVRKLAVRVDEEGIHYPRGWIPVIAWADVVSVERLPKVRREGSETIMCLRDAWRPLAITVRNPEKYLLRVQKLARASFSSMAPSLDRTTIQIEFMGLTPGSDVVEACLRQHLARTGSIHAAS